MADDNEGLLDQSEIEALFGALSKEGGGAAPPSAAPGTGAAPAPSHAPAAGPAASASGVDPNVFKVQPYTLNELRGGPSQTVDSNDINLISDVDLNVRVELGRAQMYIEDVLRLREGSIVPLEKLAGDPVDIFVNGQLIARGEVLVLNDNFCVRVSEIIGERQFPAAEAS